VEERRRELQRAAQEEGKPELTEADLGGRPAGEGLRGG